MTDAPRREPAFNIPGAVLGLVCALALAHVARISLGLPPETFALTREDLATGLVWPLFSYVFVHGGWAHLIMNSLFIVAFGAPVARWLGGGFGALIFFIFFMVCGVVAALGYAAVQDQLLARFGSHPWALVGASGAASGLMGAAVRLIEGAGRLGPITGRRVFGMTVGWIGVNVLLGVSGLTPGSQGVPVAWEAHIVGYFAGLLLIGLAGRAANAPR